jgi:hypothetical protein
VEPLQWSPTSRHGGRRPPGTLLSAIALPCGGAGREAQGHLITYKFSQVKLVRFASLRATHRNPVRHASNMAPTSWEIKDLNLNPSPAASLGSGFCGVLSVFAALPRAASITRGGGARSTGVPTADRRPWITRAPTAAVINKRLLKRGYQNTFYW